MSEASPKADKIIKKQDRVVIVRPYIGKLKKFGRRVVLDPKDAQYPMRLSSPLQTVRTSKYWMDVDVEHDDQGSTSHCVAYAWTRYLTAHNTVNKAPFPPKELYSRAQKVDEWAGEEPTYEGTSVRAGAKVLAAEGLISEYRWGRSAAEVVQHLLTKGPVVVGTDWHRGMSMLDKHGFIEPSGPIDGGHAYLLIGVNTKKRNPLRPTETGAVRIVNSWGRKWGDGGRAWMLVSDLDKLIKAYGEACVATEVKQR